MNDGMKKVLVVDDEKDIRDLLRYNLEKEGYEVLSAANGPEALREAEKQPDVIVLDVMMPGYDGREVMRRLKSNPLTADIPVMFLTARSTEIDEVVGFELGADDYLVKPVSVPKLLARVRSILRRHGSTLGGRQPELISAGAISIHREKHQITVGKDVVFFPKKEFELLSYLTLHAGSVVNRETLLRAVWGSEVLVGDRTIDVHIRRIREKLGEYAEQIETIKGVGYRICE